MNHLYPDMLKVNDHDDITRWWEVIDRTTGEVVPTEQWSYDSESGDVTIHSAKAFHDYTVSFLAYIMWDPVHMYNAVTNGWTDFEKQITFDVRQPKTHKIFHGASQKIYSGQSTYRRDPLYDIFPSVYTDF